MKRLKDIWKAIACWVLGHRGFVAFVAVDETGNPWCESKDSTPGIVGSVPVLCLRCSNERKDSSAYLCWKEEEWHVEVDLPDPSAEWFTVTGTINCNCCGYNIKANGKRDCRCDQLPPCKGCRKCGVCCKCHSRTGESK